MGLYPTRTAKLLTLAGILPFAGGLLGQYFVPWAAPWPAATAAYGAVIAAFIAGIHWAVHLFQAERVPINLLLSSNAVALSAWLALLLPAGPAPFRLLIVVFVVLILIDQRLHKAGLIPHWFYRLRLQASTLVCLCLLGMALVAM